jgi:3-hydroxybutyryl-CoA dehydratase
MIFTPGKRFEERFTVSEEIYRGFIHLFKDRNPLHTDEQFSLSKGFQSKVMHGNILNGFISYFIGECLPLKNVIIHSQEIQYKNPVYMNDELQFIAVVNDIFESVNAVEFSFSFLNKSKTVAKGKFQIGILP